MADDHRTEIEKSARAGMEAQGGAALARELMRTQSLAVLATVSVRHGGGPFTSLAPYALSAHGEPVLLLSALAQHTRNVEVDPRASLFIHDAPAPGADPRTAPRLALVGHVRRATAAEEPGARARYLARHPEARGLLALDFALYVLAIEEAHLVGGFASAGWIPGEQIRGATPGP